MCCERKTKRKEQSNRRKGITSSPSSSSLSSPGNETCYSFVRKALQVNCYYNGLNVPCLRLIWIRFVTEVGRFNQARKSGIKTLVREFLDITLC